MKTIKLKKIAEFLNTEILGDSEQEISGIQGILEAGPGDLTFLANPKYKDKLPLCQASGILVDRGIEVAGKNLIPSDNPRMDFAKIVRLLVPVKTESGQISDQAVISSSASFGENTTIYPGVYLGENVTIGNNSVIYSNVFIGDNVTVGDDCVIYSNVSIHHETRIGDRVLISSNSVLGSEGFGFERDGDRHFKIPQVGNVIIEDDVEIGALCAIDRGSIKSTIIGKGTKLDNLIHVAHNCQVGENNLILSQAGLSGTVKTGHNVYFAGKSGCADHIQIADRVQIGGAAIVTGSIEKEGMYFGYPARPYQEWKKANALFYKSDEMRRKNLDLEKRVKLLEEKLSIDGDAG
ncbi:MAG: UDP-3-O-(3-hydroxymyristoyl)glucosamine N-acyltransferase [Proteobacteria bacterium]|nr:UDP-3-O-(3-hydroxymyristoyl)glucosamine N-acyltransferase [Pseudomonadota bacterium]